MPQELFFLKCGHPLSTIRRKMQNLTKCCVTKMGPRQKPLRYAQSFCGDFYFHSPPNVCTHNNLTTKYKQLCRSPQKVTGSESKSLCKVMNKNQDVSSMTSLTLTPSQHHPKLIYTSDSIGTILNQLSDHKSYPVFSTQSSIEGFHFHILHMIEGRSPVYSRAFILSYPCHFSSDLSPFFSVALANWSVRISGFHRRIQLPNDNR